MLDLLASFMGASTLDLYRILQDSPKMFDSFWYSYVPIGGVAPDSDASSVDGEPDPNDLAPGDIQRIIQMDVETVR